MTDLTSARPTSHIRAGQLDLWPYLALSPPLRPSPCPFLTSLSFYASSFSFVSCASPSCSSLPHSRLHSFPLPAAFISPSYFSLRPSLSPFHPAPLLVPSLSTYASSFSSSSPPSRLLSHSLPVAFIPTRISFSIILPFSSSSARSLSFYAPSFSFSYSSPLLVCFAFLSLSFPLILLTPLLFFSLLLLNSSSCPIYTYTPLPP